MEDYYVDVFDFYSSRGVILTDTQKTYLLNLEKILSGNIRNDYALLCNVYNLYMTTGKKRTVDKYYNMIPINTGKVGNTIRFTEVLAEKFGLSEKYIYTLLKIADKFIDFLAGEKFRIAELSNLTISKMQELLPLSINTIQEAFRSKQITYKSTKKELRQYVQSVKKPNSEDKKVIEDNLEETLDESTPSQVYISLPPDILEFCASECAEQQIPLADYIIALIKQKMRSKSKRKVKTESE